MPYLMNLDLAKTMNDIKFYNDDGTEYVPKHSEPIKPTIPFAPGTPGLVLVAITDKPEAIKLERIQDMLGSFVNKFPAMIQASPEVSVGLCIYDEDKGGWRPLSTEDLSRGSNRR